MGIALAVQQTGLRNEYQKAMINVIYTSNWLQEKVKKILEHEDITPQQYNILRILRSNKAPLSTLQIRERMLDKMSDTSRIVDRLVLKNLVEKKTSAVDKRLVDVTINEAGLNLLEKLDHQNEQMDGLIGNLAEEEVKMLNNLLEKISNR